MRSHILLAACMHARLQVRVLNKEPKGRDVEQGDTFTFNAAFADKQFRIKINTIQLKETEEENKKTNEQVGPRQKRACPARSAEAREDPLQAGMAVNAFCAWSWTLCRSIMLFRLKAAAIWLWPFEVMGRSSHHRVSE